MPRSTRKISADVAARQRCRALIERVAKSYDGNIDAVSIVQRIQWAHAKSVEGDKPMLRYLWAKGLEPEVRRALSEWGGFGTHDEEPPQLDLFPANERDLVKQIGKARIWLPSRKAHVQYHDLSADEVEESGIYYKVHGQGEIDLGDLLLTLADLRRRAYAA